MENNEQLNFFSQTSYRTPVVLDENFESVNTPEGFRGITFYPHQGIVVKAMLDLENIRHVRITDESVMSMFETDRDVIIETSAMVLSTPFGSGKTFMILGLILSRPIPKAIPESLGYIFHNRELQNNRSNKFTCEIQRRFVGDNVLISPNIIIVGSSVLVQWENSIRNYTNLRFFTIGGYHHMVKFYEYYKAGTLNNFDIILVKNGNITGNFLIDGEDRDEVNEVRSIVNVLGRMFRQNVCARVIYDDFDTIRIPADAKLINALFTVYVSATRKSTKRAKLSKKEYENFDEWLVDERLPIASVLSDELLFSNFAIVADEEMIKKSTKIPTANIYKCTYKNPDDNYIGLIGAIGGEEATEIMEMLNGDALETAAERMNIKTTSVADIFKRMLDKKYTEFIQARNSFRVADIARKTHESTMPMDGKYHTLEQIHSIIGILKKGQVAHFNFNSAQMASALDNFYAEAREQYNQCSIAITRVVDNLKEGTCQICAVEFSDLDGASILIVKCCGLIVCEFCCTKGNQIQNTYDPRTKRTTLIGACGNCKRPVYPARDLIYISKDINPENIIKALTEGYKDEPETEQKVEKEKVEAPKKRHENPKIVALLDIIEDKVPENRTENLMTIKHLIVGDHHEPKTEEAKKVLVFANFNETLRLVEKALTDNGITYLHLSGSYREMANTVDQFRIGNHRVLLINSQQHCAGLNLQFATDLVLFHYIADENVISQVCGRAQRIGRTCSLNIYALMYNNEKNYAKA